MFSKHILALAAVVGALAAVGLTHASAIITYIKDLTDSDSDSKDENSNH